MPRAWRSSTHGKPSSSASPVSLGSGSLCAFICSVSQQTSSRYFMVAPLSSRFCVVSTTDAPLANRQLPLEVAVRDDSAAEAGDLSLRERRVGELVVQLEGAEEVDDVVHPLLEAGPVAGRAVVHLEPGEELLQLGVGGLGQLGRVRVVEVRAERQHA